jgi:hypothetical protein
MADFWKVKNRRDEFAGDSFDEMIGRIMDLEDELESARDDIANLKDQVEQLEADV